MSSSLGILVVPALVGMIHGPGLLGYPPQDTDVLRTLVRHSWVQLGELGQYHCAGAYAVVTAQGTVRTGDRIMLN